MPVTRRKKVRRKNSFGSPKYVDHVINNSDRAKKGTLRVKPSGVAWKPAGKQRFHAVSLDQFTSWITDPQNGSQIRTQ